MSTYLGTLPVLTCQTTNSSSDTNFTELTTGTSIKTHNNGSFIVVDQHDLAHERQPSSENKAAEIRGYYESNPPDVAAEMEKWYAATDRSVLLFCIDDDHALYWCSYYRYGFLENDKLFTPDAK